MESQPGTMNLLQHRSGSSVWERPERIPAGDTDLALTASARDGPIVPDPLDEASEESFPASDAPAWTPLTGSLDGLRHASLATGRIEWALHERLRQHAILWACGAGSALIAVYLIVLALTNSLEHATTELLRLKYWMTALVLGFGLQVGLFAYARAAAHGHAIHARGVAAAGSTSTAAMIACCAHHLTDVLPFIGLTGAALFLSAYQTLFLLLGVLSNAVGVVYVLGIVRRHRLFPERRSVLSLVVRGPVDRALYPVAVASAVLFIGAVIFAAG